MPIKKAATKLLFNTSNTQVFDEHINYTQASNYLFDDSNKVYALINIDSTVNDINHLKVLVINPKYNNNVIPRTFLYHLFVTNKKSNKSKWNEFNQGNIFGNVFSGKNFYDSKYSTAVSSSGETRIYPVRKYVKIGQTGGWPFLTYYDNKTWTSTINNEDLNTDDDKVQRQGIISDNVNGRKYQHVETVQSINRFLNRGNHKSNMYSIRLNLNLNDIVNFENLSEEDKIKMNELLDTVKLDIKSSVRRISSKLAPAHTQLFKVYIDDQ